MNEIFLFSFFVWRRRRLVTINNNEKKMQLPVLLYIKITKVLNWKNYAMYFSKHDERILKFK